MPSKKFYKTVVRPTTMYEYEYYNEKEEIKTKITAMLRWMCRVTRLDRIRNGR